MSEKLLLAVVGFVGTWLLWRWQQGGRRLQRKDLREDLELLHLLEKDGRHPESAELMHARITREVQKYERPLLDPEVRRAQLLGLVGLGVAMVAIAVASFGLPTKTAAMVVPVLAVVLGGGIGVLAGRAERAARASAPPVA